MDVRRLKRVVIKEELVELTGHWLRALILNQFIYWTERSRYVDQYLKEEAARAKAGGDDDFEVMALPPTEGWTYKTAEDLRAELMGCAAEKTIRTHCKALIESGLLMERNNPRYQWDRTKQYRVDHCLLAQRLSEMGYSLDGFSVLPPETADLPDASGQMTELNRRNRPSNTKRLTTEITMPSANAEGRAGRRQKQVTGRHPAVMAWKSVTGRYPNRKQYAYVAERLGDEPVIEALEHVTELWGAHGYNPTNVAGQCDWYVQAVMSGDPLAWQPDNGRRGGGVADAAVEEAWTVVGIAVEQHGARHDPNFSDPAVQAAVDAVGWSAICQLPDDEGKRRFTEAFRPGSVQQPPEPAVATVLGAFTG